MAWYKENFTKCWCVKKVTVLFFYTWVKEKGRTLEDLREEKHLVDPYLTFSFSGKEVSKKHGFLLLKVHCPELRLGGLCLILPARL